MKRVALLVIALVMLVGITLSWNKYSKVVDKNTTLYNEVGYTPETLIHSLVLLQTDNMSINSIRATMNNLDADVVKAYGEIEHNAINDGQYKKLKSIITILEKSDNTSDFDINMELLKEKYTDNASPD